jgi:flagellar hook-length control protein FliK
MDIIPIAPAPQHNAPSAKTTRGAAGTNGESGFGTALDQAASPDDSVKQAPAQAGRNNQRKSDADTDQASGAGLDDTSRNTGNTAHESTATETTATKPAATIDADTADNDPADTDSGAAAGVVGPNLLTLLFGTSTASAATAGGQQAPFSWHSPAGPMLNSPLQTLTEEGATIKLPATGQNTLTVAIENGANPMVTPTTGRQMDALLAQLQALISGNNDQVTVTAAFQSADRATLPGYLSGPLVDALFAGANAPAGQQAKLFTGLPGEQPPVAADTLLQKIADMPVNTLRQEQAGAEGHSRLAIFQNTSGEQKNEQGGQQQPTQHQATTGPQIDANGTTSHGFTSQFQEAASQQAAAASRLTGQSSSAPAGQHVADSDVIGQIIQRFSLQTNLQTSRLNLKLHPAELGELKISLVVKEDSLKANIYAQTRQAQEIIEKHLPRLKTVLEEQGLLVEDLIVTLESEFLEDSTGQQGQSFAEQMTDFSRDQLKQGNNGLFHQSLEEIPTTSGEHDPHAPSGVNLTV